MSITTTTIAFDNKRGFWKTRYTYIASCFAYLNKIFISSPKTFATEKAIYRHDAGANTVFHGGLAANSGIDITFNNNPSSNKIYKSVSIEGSSNMGGINAFKVNKSSNPSQLKTTALGYVSEKGGIVYGQVGKEITVGNGTVRTLGVVLEASLLSDVLTDELLTLSDLNLSQPSPPLNLVHFKIESSGSRPISSASKTKYLTSTASGAILMSNGEALDTEDSFSDIEANIFNTNNESISWYANGLIAQVNTEDISAFLASIVGKGLHEITEGEINGDDPKGQYAEASFALNSNNWEIFAVNVEYEPTDYSHASRVGRKPSETIED